MVNQLNQLLIVTCDKHQLQFLIQCESLGKYLDPVQINIIINEIDPRAWIDWFYKHCADMLAKHSVEVLTWNDFDENFSFENVVLRKPGWITQQIFKLLFALRTSNNYVVFDTKNWLIQSAKLQDFCKRPRNPIGSQIPMCFEKFYLDTLAKICPGKYLAFRPEITPYIIDPMIVRKMFDSFGGVHEFQSWFASYEAPSEFIVYDIFAQHHGLDNAAGQYSNNTVYYFDELDIDLISKNIQDPNLQMLSVHPKLLDHTLLLQLQTQLNTR